MSRNIFSSRVYQALSSVAEGHVTTYGFLAAAAGSPGASRAVGQLMASNRDFVRFPCHRVVRSDGSTGGYGGGYERVNEKVEKLFSEGISLDKSGKVENFSRKVIKPVCCNILDAEKQEHFNSVQSILLSAEDYTQTVFGRLPDLNDARKTFEAIPPGKGYEDKFVAGFSFGDDMIGCADIVRDFPVKGILYVGLLLIQKDYRGQGCGLSALQHIEILGREWKCGKLRLAVIETNKRALNFWKREGFEEIELKSAEGCAGKAIVMERNNRVPLLNDR